MRRASARALLVALAVACAFLAATLAPSQVRRVAEMNALACALQDQLNAILLAPAVESENQDWARRKNCSLRETGSTKLKCPGKEEK